jgi:VanZ family protein
MRRAYAGAAVAAIAFVLYGSLLPFDLHPTPVGEAWQSFITRLLDPTSEYLSRTNFLANILLFVPVGFCLMGAALADRSQGARAAGTAIQVLCEGVALSALAEFAQTFAPDRIPSRLDMAAQTVGAIVGVIAWIAIGPALTDWLRDSSRRAHGDRLTRALVGYGVLWAFTSLAPFDVSVDLGEIAERLRTGAITLRPFGSPVSPARQAWDATATFLSTVPIGALALVGWRSDSTRRHAFAAWGLGVAAVVTIEGAQIFIQSHAADITDVLFGALGTAAGVWIGVRTSGRDATNVAIDAATRTGAALTALWGLVICAYHWQPFDFGLDRTLIGDKLSRISLVPFAGYFVGPELNAFNTLLSKIAVAMPLGLFAAFASRRAGLARPLLIAGWLAIAAAFFSGVEFGQLFVPSRFPDPTDVMVGVAASLGGLWLGEWLQSGASLTRRSRVGRSRSERR